jgi:proteic killer suppression protein
VWWGLAGCVLVGRARERAALGIPLDFLFYASFRARRKVGQTGGVAARAEGLTSDDCHYTLNNVIASFEHKGLRKLFEGDGRYVEGSLRNRIARVLSVMDAAGSIAELKIPGFRLHELSGDLNGLWSITVSGNWRITFRFAGGQFHALNLVDYH